MNTEVETAIGVSKWVSLVDHLRTTVSNTCFVLESYILWALPTKHTTRYLECASDGFVQVWKDIQEEWQTCKIPLY
jgi:hypothetical protein